MLPASSPARVVINIFENLVPVSHHFRASTTTLGYLREGLSAVAFRARHKGMVDREWVR